MVVLIVMGVAVTAALAMRIAEVIRAWRDER